jgi:hypothetical protein
MASANKSLRRRFAGCTESASACVSDLGLVALNDEWRRIRLHIHGPLRTAQICVCVGRRLRRRRRPCLPASPPCGGQQPWRPWRPQLVMPAVLPPPFFARRQRLDISASPDRRPSS